MYDISWPQWTLTVPTEMLRVDSTAKDYLEFQSLVEEWHKERGATSSATEMAMCLSYQCIIAMGPPVIPLILRRMEAEGDEPDMWFWALRVLTREDPVPEDARGNIAKMSQAWLAWALGRYAW